MPNQVTVNGLVTKTRQEIEAELVAAFQSIYGNDINLSQDTPDGQILNIFIQSYLDLLELVKAVYTSFDPDQAFGVTLDQRVAFNGIQRQAGTYTVTDITVVISQPLNLYGLDQDEQDVYTVADNAGNEWQLIDTVSLNVLGANVLAFRAKVPGAQLTIPNTITVPKTIVLGVTSVNNPTAYTSLGLNEETDQQLRTRRQRAVSISSQGYLAGLIAALENINGIISVFVYENNEDGIVDGVAGHSIWVIVSGTYDDADVADAIYKKRNAGCGMKGDKTYSVQQVDGTEFLVRWDDVQTEPLFIKFNVTSLNGVNPPDIATIKAGLAENFIPGVYEQVNINDLATLVQQFDNNTLVTLAGFGLGAFGPFSNFLQPSEKNKQFTVDANNIIILPMQLTPSVVTLAALGTQQFTPLGGYGAMTYTLDVNASGGSIDPQGLYTAGPTPAIDVVKVTDSQGNFATATVNVV